MPVLLPCVSALLAFAVACFRRVRAGRTESALFLALSLVLLLEAASELLAPGRDVFPPGGLVHGLFLPGSMSSRIAAVAFPDWFSAPLRRACDPALLALVLLLAFLPSCFRLAALALAGAVVAEIVSFPQSFGKAVKPLPLETCHEFFLGVFWTLLFFGLAVALRRKNPPACSSTDRGYRWLVLFLMLLFLCVSAVLSDRALSRDPRPLALAHYYSWFPENWAAGYTGRTANPPLRPDPGEYVSGSEAIVHRHAEWAKQAGIDCFVLDWWPTRGSVRDRALRAASQLSSKENLCTVLLYETLDLRQPHEGLTPGERENIVFLSEKRASGMAKQWVRLVEDYMRRPGYLRIDGRPVLFLYATRHLVGDVPARIADARRFVREQTGEELFLVGDEVYFEVPAGDEKEVSLLPTFQPNWDRLRAFDALGAYNPYDASRVRHGGAEGAPAFLADTQSLFQHYQGIAAALGIPFVPLAMPGYDDTEHRPRAGHFVIPRVFAGRSMLAESLDRWVRPAAARGAPFFTLTSWNEWNEGTAIEPFSPASTAPGDPLRGLMEVCRFLGGFGRQRNCEESSNL